MKNKCDKCGRTSSIHDMDNCPFCKKEEEEKEESKKMEQEDNRFDTPAYERAGIKITPAERIKKEDFEDEKFDYHPRPEDVRG
jgi:hypothetical protein